MTKIRSMGLEQRSGTIAMDQGKKALDIRHTQMGRNKRRHIRSRSKEGEDRVNTIQEVSSWKHFERCKINNKYNNKSNSFVFSIC